MGLNEWWASWWDPTCLDPIPPGATFRFQFNNTNPSRWWDWTTTESANDDPYGLVADASWNHVTEPNGYGYRVHVPRRPQVSIIGTLTNFDAHQGSFTDEADDFELDFLGQIDASDFYGFYPGWGTPPRFDEIRIQGEDEGAEVMWLDRINSIPFCQWVHFGVNVNPALPPTIVRAWWTKINKEEQIPVPFQWWWLIDPWTVIDLLTLSPTFPEPVIYVREWAMSQEPVALEEMMYDGTPVEWWPFDQGVLNPGDINEELVLPVEPGIAGYLVRYAVWTADAFEPITRFVTQAVIPQPGFIERVLVNFDIHQDNPDAVYENVELDLFGDWLNPWMVWRWYDVEAGPGTAWGVPPLIRRFPPLTFPEMPDRGGIEITWVDKFEPFRYCQTYHFGLELDPAVMQGWPPEPTWVQAYWTTIDRAPVPVPWQFWETEGGVVRDIILYGGEGLGPVMVNREWATWPDTIPLEELTWDEVEFLPWEQVPGDPQGMNPGDIIELEIPVDEEDRAVLVRYTVENEYGRLTTRVINEALVDVLVGIPDDRGGLPDGQHGLYLAPSRPNPAAGTAEIRFRLPEDGTVRLVVVDVAGRLVTVLHDGGLEAGDHLVTWDGRTSDGGEASSGIYFITLTAGTRTMTERVVLVR